MYYRVTALRGHNGIGKSTDISFVFECKNAMSAMEAAKSMPAVKHSKGVLCVCEISREEYIDRRRISAYARPKL